MSFGILDTCCRVVNLRTGTFIIAGVYLVFETISLILHSVMAWVMTQVNRSNQHNDAYTYVQKFVMFFVMLMIVFKLVLTAALLVGMVKRLPDHLEMWYKGCLLCVILETVITIATAVVELEKNKVWFWIIIAVKTINILVTFYFILVVRSYYYMMCGESNYYQNFNNGDSKEQLKSEKNKCHTYEEVMFNENAGTKEDLEAPKYGFTKKGGGIIYSCPKSQPNAVMDMPMPTLENNKVIGNNQTSMLYPALVQ